MDARHERGFRYPGQNDLQSLVTKLVGVFDYKNMYKLIIVQRHEKQAICAFEMIGIDGATTL